MKGVYLKKGNTRVSVVPYYRIGDLFLTTIATNPSSYLGGTWELFGPGRCLVCVNTSDSDFNTVKKTGGSKTHRHDFQIGFKAWWGAIGLDAFTDNCGAWSSSLGKYSKEKGTHLTSQDSVFNNSFTNAMKTLSESTRYSKGDTDLSNSMQPYITCYIWIRTA